MDTIATKVVPAEVQQFAREVPEVKNSKTSPCWQQRQIAKQQSFLKTAANGGKEVVRRVHPKCALSNQKKSKATS